MEKEKAGNEKKPVSSPVVAPSVALPEVIISVRRLRDAGGDPDRYKGPDGKPLTQRTAEALSRVLAERANNRYQVPGFSPVVPPAKDGKNDAKPASVRFIIDGDLSALESPYSGDDAKSINSESRPYLLVARVWQEKPRRLVAQFVGVAGSLRDLTGNLTAGAQSANGATTGAGIALPATLTNGSLANPVTTALGTGQGTPSPNPAEASPSTTSLTPPTAPSTPSASVDPWGVVGEIAERVGRATDALRAGKPVSPADCFTPPVGISPIPETPKKDLNGKPLTPRGSVRTGQ
jgi:hypothetical protein